MPTNKLPVQGGGEIDAKDVEDGWLLQLECGAVVPAIRNKSGAGIDEKEPLYCRELYNSGGSYLSWTPGGKALGVGNHARLDIVLILESVDNGDGTVTKLWPVVATQEMHSRLDGPAYIGTIGKKGDYPNGIFGHFKVKPIPKPDPSPFVKELVRRVVSGGVVLPPGALSLRYTDQTMSGGWWQFIDARGCYENWYAVASGPLPSLKDYPHDSDSVSLDEVRELVKEAKK